MYTHIYIYVTIITSYNILINYGYMYSFKL